MLSKEAKVGAFTLVGALCFLSAVMFIEGMSFFAPSNMNIEGSFDSVTGLKEGYPIRYSGVDVGKVKQIEVSPQEVKVQMSLEKDVQVPADSSFTIEGDGLLGEKFIQIHPGTSSRYLRDGDQVKGVGHSSVDQALVSATEVMKEANSMMKSINAIIGDTAVQASMKNTVHRTDGIAKNIESMTAQMNALISANADNVQEITHNMLVISRNMNELTKQLHDSFETIDGDGKTSTNVRSIAANMQEASLSINRMAKSLEGVIADPESMNNLRETLQNTAEFSKSANSLTGGSQGIGITPEVSVLYQLDSKSYDSNLSFRFMNSHTVAEVGASHIGNGTATELNFGKRKGDFALRGGLFDGDIGVGLDYGLDKPFSLSLAAINPNDMRYRLRGQLRLFGDAYLMGQFIRPYTAPHSGNYIGLQYRY